MEYLLKIMSFGNIEIIGSMSDEKLKYYNDIDTQEYINITEKNTEKDIYKDFLKKLNQITKSDMYFMTDFKCGIMRAGVPVRWNISEIFRGYKIIENHKYFFKNGFIQINTVKVDFIFFENGDIQELSINYYFNKNNKPISYIEQSTNDVIRSLLRDARELYYEGNYLKSLKRVYRVLILKNEKNKIDVFSKFFNSDIGYINMILSKIEIFNELKKMYPDRLSYIENMYKINIYNKIMNEIQQYGLSKKLYYIQQVSKKFYDKNVKILNLYI
jgi:hypothetical protein